MHFLFLFLFFFLFSFFLGDVDKDTVLCGFGL